VKLASVEIENYRAIEGLELEPDPALTVLFGTNGCGKTSVLSGIATGLGAIQSFFFPRKGINFLKTDRRANGEPVRIRLTPTGGLSWLREETGRGFAKITENKMTPWYELRRWLADIRSRHEKGEVVDLPIIAFYDTDRVVFDAPRRRRGFAEEFDRFGALEGALSARTDFRQFFQWFYAMENAEFRASRSLRERGRDSGAGTRAVVPELHAVRSAIEAMVKGVTSPRIEENPLRFVVSRENESTDLEELALDQLSGGYRAVLTLAADLARRMAQGNPHLEDPLKSEAVVLIDEIELHLHPEWQQRILGDLRRTFPNAQFIVSTHSPQVLTTVEPKHILELVDDDGSIVARAPASSTFGVEAGDVLSTVMGVDERPDNWYTTALNAYRRLVSSDQGESEEAQALRTKLEDASPDDPALHRADLEVRQRRMFRRMSESK